VNALVNSPTSLPLFTYNVLSSRDGNTYTGVIVGKDPFHNGGGGTANVVTQVVPLVIETGSVGIGFDQNLNVVTVPGETNFDPRKADGCLVSPNNIPLKLVQQSPIIKSADFNFGGTDVGTTQYIDAFQRASFWNVINQGTYHMKLSPVKTLPAITLKISPASSLAIAAATFGGCGTLGVVDINVFDAILTSTVLPALASKGVTPGTFPMFILSNVVTSAGDPRQLLFNCCFLGYHGSSGTGPIQTYSPSDFDSTGVFGSAAQDTSILAHEVGEWANDPFGNNPTPAWGHTGQVGGCQGNLEVGDPLTGTLAPPIFMPNGFTYHLQELAFFSWFYGAPSVGLHGWFSNNGTFLSDAGPPCT
jgi:hypothetical protein